MHIVYGLGNPGRSYSGQRHNAGRMLVEQFAGDLSVSFDRNREGVRFGEGRWNGEQVAVANPTTYMNEAGAGYERIRSYYGTQPVRTLVVLDDMDLPLGKLRIRPSGSDGGHRGMRSVLRTVDSNDVPRMRVGIGRPPEGVSPSDYVLEQFTGEEREELEKVIDDGVSAVKTWLTDGIRPAMNQYNS